jgi:Rrf2 family protein
MAKDESRLYSVNDIFEQVEIPFRYLRKLMTALTKYGFVLSIQGKYGGYKIAKKLDDIALIDIINSLDPEFNSNLCFFGLKDCAFQPACIMHNQWTDVRTRVNNILSSTTLLNLKQNELHNLLNNNIIH